MNTQKMIITPSMAKSFLENNFGNRRLDEARIEQYSKDMIAGKWNSNTGETIKITVSNRFADGQHRLHAIIKANIPVEMAVTTGVSDDAFKYIDTGKPRTAADVFFIEDIKNANNVSAIINKYLIFKAEKYSAGSAKWNKMTTHQILDFYNQNPNYYQSVCNLATNWYNAFGKVLSSSVIGAYYMYFKDIDENDALKFMNQLCVGVEIENSAILMLRQKLINDKTSRVNNLPIRLKHALIIKTWNYFRKNQKINLLRYTEQQEEFPKAI